MRYDQEHWYYTVDEAWRFHSFDDEPAVVVESYMWKNDIWEDEWINWYKARYTNGQMDRVERDPLPDNQEEEWQL